MRSLAGVLILAALLALRGIALAAPAPQDWAFSDIRVLVADGVIDGYPPDAFAGKQSLSRTELALLTARAVAKVEASGASAADEARVQALSTEFRSELDALGVRESDLSRLRAALDARTKLIQIAVADAQSPVHGANPDDVDFKDGKVQLKSSPQKSEAFTALLARHGNQPVEGTSHQQPQADAKETPSHSFGAVFAEVAVDPYIGMTRVRRVVAVYDVGRVINKKLAASQFIGGIVWGISLALLEDTHLDQRYGRFTNSNLAEYLVPANLDIGEIDVSALDIPDPKLNSLGARGIGEIGITGSGAAVANAIYHATGKRVRDLPITPDKLITV